MAKEKVSTKLSKMLDELDAIITEVRSAKDIDAEFYVTELLKGYANVGYVAARLEKQDK